jgi:hypothetical protein
MSSAARSARWSHRSLAPGNGSWSTNRTGRRAVLPVTRGAAVDQRSGCGTSERVQRLGYRRLASGVVLAFSVREGCLRLGDRRAVV